MWEGVKGEEWAKLYVGAGRERAAENKVQNPCVRGTTMALHTASLVVPGSSSHWFEAHVQAWLTDQQYSLCSTILLCDIAAAGENM